MRESTAQIDHFIAFITGHHIIQVLPFGERTITLSTKETIEVPNVIRMIIPERIVIQYMTYCQSLGSAVGYCQRLEGQCEAVPELDALA